MTKQEAEARLARIREACAQRKLVCAEARAAQAVAALQREKLAAARETVMAFAMEMRELLQKLYGADRTHTQTPYGKEIGALLLRIGVAEARTQA